MSKVVVVLLALALLYLRLLRRRREADRVCAGCGERNPRHLTHCRNCSARL
jgi:ribosomal protein L40E